MLSYEISDTVSVVFFFSIGGVRGVNELVSEWDVESEVLDR